MDWIASADDTGLEVEALNGKPGVRTARYAGEDADATQNMAKLLEKLSGTEHRERNSERPFAWCAAAWRSESRVCKGRIAQERSGADGFGYDPVFIPEGENRTFAEMSPADKNAISHRGIACRMWRRPCWQANDSGCFRLRKLLHLCSCKTFHA